MPLRIRSGESGGISVKEQTCCKFSGSVTRSVIQGSIGKYKILCRDVEDAGPYKDVGAKQQDLI